MIEPAFLEDLQMLANALRHEGFRFVLVGHNRRSIFKDIAAWLHAQFPHRLIFEIRFEGKDYRQIADELLDLKNCIVLIPDFDWLFRAENETVCVAFNQRRDAFAHLDLALVCFIQPGNFVQVPKKVPDWWSLRSLELDFHRDVPDDAALKFQTPDFATSAFSGKTKEEKKAEIARLLEEFERARLDDKIQLQALCWQAGDLHFQNGLVEKALYYFEKSLELSREINDRRSEGAALYNIGLTWHSKGDNEAALKYLQRSLEITREVGDQQGEGAILNNMAAILAERGDYDTARKYLDEASKIQQFIGDWKGVAVTIENLRKTQWALYEEKGFPALSKMREEYVAQTAELRHEIQQLIAEGRFDEAISKLLNLPGQLPRIRNDITHLASRWEQVRRQQLLGVVSYSEANIEHSRIASALLNLLKHLA